MTGVEKLKGDFLTENGGGGNMYNNSRVAFCFIPFRGQNSFLGEVNGRPSLPK